MHLYNYVRCIYPIALLVFAGLFQIKPYTYVVHIDIEVSRLAILCPCLLRIMILCYSPKPKVENQAINKSIRLEIW